MLESPDAEILVRASMGRRFLSILYEMAFLSSVLAFLAVVTTAIEYFSGAASLQRGAVLPIPLTGWASYLVQIAFLVICGLYYTYCWRKSGQTLAMKSWRIRLICNDENVLSWKKLWLRYFYVVVLFPVNFLWGFWDSDRQFLHDRWCHTAIVLVKT